MKAGPSLGQAIGVGLLLWAMALLTALIFPNSPCP